MSWLENTADDARASIAADNQSLEDRLQSLLQQFRASSPMVRGCLKDLGDECLGRFLGFPLYRQGETCDKRLDGSHCWYISKKIKEMRYAAENVRLVERLENFKFTGGYYFEVQGTGIITKDQSS